MQKVMNRFWEWLFHPGINARIWRDHKGFIYRYPATGNNNQSNKEFHPVQDYKTPYTYSKYNIRYTHQTPIQAKLYEEFFVMENGLMDPLAKLRGLGYLKPGEQSNAERVAEAKKNFQADYKNSVDDNIIFHRPAYPDGTTHSQTVNYDPKSRESLRNLIELQFKHNAEAKKSGEFPEFDVNPQDPIDVPVQSLDLYTLPHFQQSKMENEYFIDKTERENIERGGYTVLKGQRRFWKALDETNDPKDIKAVQSSIKQGEDANNFQLKNGQIKIITDKNGKVIDIQSQLNK